MNRAMPIQRIQDERLALKNLQNIRYVYVLQTLGIIGILAYKFVAEGMNSLIENPSLLMLFIVSTILLAFLSNGRDERLLLRNLQIMRIAYAIQTLGIIGILLYDFILSGMNGMKQNPLWILFIVVSTILAFLSMDSSVEHETNDSSPLKGLLISLLVVTGISIVTGIFTSYSEGFTGVDGLLTGGLFLICGSVPFLFIYNLRKKKRDENMDE
ncbi:hypothetical protein HNO89_003578 [Sporosarcina luteola]|nr:hypothetical protein [Sporosarcina luteola]